jgi:glycosyltransferase involved in cell wall biosynthesis
MPLISVVIPVHGVEDYLGRCLDSVLSDVEVPVEVIAVDDASPDRCGAILAARQDPRLRILTTPVRRQGSTYGSSTVTTNWPRAPWRRRPRR